MGYDIRLVVVEEHYPDNGPQTGTFLASVELGKCGVGPVYDLVQSRIKESGDGDPPFALYSTQSDRLQEATEVLRDFAKSHAAGDAPCDLERLACDIENGYITTDPYGYYLGVYTLDEMIAALEKDKERIENRFSVVALALLKAFKETHPKSKRLKVVSYSH